MCVKEVGVAQGLESSREASCSPRARPEPDGTEANAAVAVAAWDASNEGVRLRRLKVAMMLALPITMGHCLVAYRLEGAPLHLAVAVVTVVALLAGAFWTWVVATTRTGRSVWCPPVKSARRAWERHQHHGWPLLALCTLLDALLHFNELTATRSWWWTHPLLVFASHYLLHFPAQTVARCTAGERRLEVDDAVAYVHTKFEFWPPLIRLRRAITRAWQPPKAAATVASEHMQAPNMKPLVLPLEDAPKGSSTPLTDEALMEVEQHSMGERRGFRKVDRPRLSMGSLTLRCSPLAPVEEEEEQPRRRNSMGNCRWNERFNLGFEQSRALGRAQPGGYVVARHTFPINPACDTRPGAEPVTRIVWVKVARSGSNMKEGGQKWVEHE